MLIPRDRDYEDMPQGVRLLNTPYKAAGYSGGKRKSKTTAVQYYKDGVFQRDFESIETASEVLRVGASTVSRLATKGGSSQGMEFKKI